MDTNLGSETGELEVIRFEILDFGVSAQSNASFFNPKSKILPLSLSLI